MGKAKTIVVAFAGAVAIFAVCAGLNRYRDYKRACADRRATDCIRQYASIVGDGKAAVPAEKLEPVLAEMAALSGECSEDFAELLFNRRLDGAFLIGDYSLAEKMMDDLKGKSKSWKEGAKAKVRAHAALARGDKAAAIGEFEKFCQALLQEDPDFSECDPSSGLEWSREALLARNLKRMGELAAEIGDKDRSEKFLFESRQYAKVALQKAEDDPVCQKVLFDDFGSLVK